MESLIDLLFSLLALFIITLPISLAFFLIFALSPFREKLVYWRYKHFPYKHHPEIIRALVRYFPYYNQLNHDLRRRFELRLLIFLDSKKFIGHNGLILTERMKILISASAIQLTFGLSYFRMKNFHAIYVYPDVYKYRHFKAEFRGHVSEFGTIHLSWNNFERGYLFPDDGINLGLHEMMHALKLYALQHRVDFTFYDNNEIIENLAKLEMQKIKSKNIEFFKNRLIHNIDELLAVSAECFFELPLQFSKELPELFESMKRLLNQDPLNPKIPVIGRYSESGFLD